MLQITLSMVLIGALEISRGCLVTVAQILGGIAAAAFIPAMFPGQLAIETRLSGQMTPIQGYLVETFLTAEFVFVIILLAVEKHRLANLAPIGIGIALFLTELCGKMYPDDISYLTLSNTRTLLT
jgi:aquaporin related protein